MVMPLPLLVEAGLRGGFVALMGLLVWRLARGPQHTVTRLGLAMCLGAAAYAVQAPQAAQVAQGVLPLWQWPLQALMNANPVVMWLLAGALFDDAFRPRAWHAALWLVWAAIGLGNCAFWHRAELAWLTGAGPFVFSLAALWAMLRSWRGDLVEQRIRWRLRVVVMMVGYTVLAAAAGIPATAAPVSPWPGLLDAAALLAVAAVAAGAMLELRPGFWTVAEARPLPEPGRVADWPAHTAAHRCDGTVADAAVANERAMAEAGPDGASDMAPEQALAQAGPASLPAPDPGALARLERAMQQEQIFRREGLTIGSLAAHLGLPEYRLRRVINGQLGHRNFNAYLNGHRITWACAALADPARAGSPVLTLALEAGFQSLGPFNRAFKASTGLTPTEYRARALAATR